MRETTDLCPLLLHVIDPSHALPVPPVLALPKQYTGPVEPMQMVQSSIQGFPAVRSMWISCSMW